MARIRSNFFSGTLSSQLLSGSTTLMSAALASFPEVAGTDVAYLVIDPEGLTPEIVKVTAHSVAATSATVERGQDSTTDRTWASGTTVIQAPIASDVDAATLAADAAFSGSYVAKGTAATNVLDRADPLKNAIGDGSAHPLSERFATLGAAQAVFPRAGALTEQIDRHAIQEALDNHAAVYLPAGTYRIDDTIFTADGTYDHDYGNQIIYGDGPGATILKLVDSIAAVWILASGNCRGLTVISGPSSTDIPNACDNLRVAGLSLDGNSGSTTTANTAQKRHGAYFGRCNNLDLVDLEARYCRQDGIVVNGISDVTTTGITLRRLRCHHNDNRGMSVRNQIRYTTYTGIYCHDNTGDGLIIDHSESVATAINCHQNGGYGLFIRNTQSNNISGVRCTKNAFDGVRVSEFENGLLSNVVALSNGTAGTSYHDVTLDADTLGSGYGITSKSQIANVVCGVGENITGGGEGYAFYIADGVSNIDIRGLTIVGSPATGGLRRNSDDTVRIQGWEPIVLSAKQLTRLSATATFTEGTSFVPYWLLDDAQSDSVCGQPNIPAGWSKVDVEIDWFVVTSAVSGNVKLDFYKFSFAPGDTISVSIVTPDQTGTVTAAAQNVVKRSTIATAVTVTPGNDAYFTARREGSAASDTLDGGNIGVLRMRLVRTA